MSRRAERHNVTDWLALHELDAAACRRILDSGELELASAPAGRRLSAAGRDPIDPEAAWLRTADAMHAFFPLQRSIIHDTHLHTVRTLVPHHDRSRRGLTLDNGPLKYPTIVYSHLGKASDCFVIAHEFGHALQIRASQGKFVPPVLREVCAFMAETALLSHTLHGDEALYRSLCDVWHRDNLKYLGKDLDCLRSALSRPDMPYSYSWNYPLARYLAINFAQRYSTDRMWTLFEGSLSLSKVLRELDLDPGPA